MKYSLGIKEIDLIANISILTGEQPGGISEDYITWYGEGNVKTSIDYTMWLNRKVVTYDIGSEPVKHKDWLLLMGICTQAGWKSEERFKHCPHEDRERNENS